jgi:alkaline phosphatase D
MAVNRRAFLRRSIAASASVLAGGPIGASQSVGLIRPSGPLPAIPYGVAAGTAGAGRAVIWSGADRAARMFVEYSTTEKFGGAAPLLLTAGTSRRVSRSTICRPDNACSIVCDSRTSAICARGATRFTGSFTTALVTASRDVTLAWAADTVGQGLGHQSRPWIAPLRGDAEGPARRVCSLRRHDLCRPTARRRSEAR